MLANRTTTWVAGASVLAVLLLLTSWFLLISPVRAAAGEDRKQTSLAVAQNATVREQLAQLRSDYVTLPAQQAQLAQLRQKVPGSTDLAALVRQLQAAADVAGVTLASINPGEAAAATAGAAPAATDPSPAASSSADAGDADGSADAAATPAAATAVAGVSGLFAMPLTITALGSFARLQVFVQQIQTDMPRAFLVTTLDLALGSGASSSETGPVDLQLSLTGSVFVLPSDSATSASASPAGSAPSATPSS